MPDDRPSDQRPSDGSDSSAHKPAQRASGGEDKGPSASTLMGVGFEFAAVIAVMTLLGWWIDGKLGTGPWLLIIGLTIGMVGGIYKLWRLGKRYFE